MSDTVLWWLRRDLRLADNDALAAALAGGRRVVPVFILDPVLLDGPRSRPTVTTDDTVSTLNTSPEGNRKAPMVPAWMNESLRSRLALRTLRATCGEAS